MIIQAFDLLNTSYAAPTCFTFKDDEDNNYNFRYRHGKYTLNRTLYNGSTETLLIGNYGDELDGFMSLSQFKDLLQTNNINLIIRSKKFYDSNTREYITQKISLSDRMKGYEMKDSNYLTEKRAVILRLDGKAFHTFTKGLDKPFDKDLSDAFVYASSRLKEHIQGIKFIYSQSDEVSILLTDWDEDNTASWFGYRIQKVVSVAASVMTMFFNEYLEKICDKYYELANGSEIDIDDSKFYWKKYELWRNKRFKASFDCRAFNVPDYEVSNYFIYRYKDAEINSIQALAQAYFSHNQLNKKSTEVLKEMLLKEKSISYEECPNIQKHGFCIYRDIKNYNESINYPASIIIDKDIPNFMQNREYIENTFKTRSKV